MKINVLENGMSVTRDMTPEEEAERMARKPTIATEEQSAEERIAELERIINSLTERLSV